MNCAFFDFAQKRGQKHIYAVFITQYYYAYLALWEFFFLLSLLNLWCIIIELNANRISFFHWIFTGAFSFRTRGDLIKLFSSMIFLEYFLLHQFDLIAGRLICKHWHVSCIWIPYKNNNTLGDKNFVCLTMFDTFYIVDSTSFLSIHSLTTKIILFFLGWCNLNSILTRSYLHLQTSFLTLKSEHYFFKIMSLWLWIYPLLFCLREVYTKYSCIIYWKDQK